MKLRCIVPMRRTFAGVGLLIPSQAQGQIRPGQRALAGGDRGAETDLDAGADRKLDRLHVDDCRRAVTLRAKLDTLVAGDDDERAGGGENSAGDDAQAVAESASRRQPQQLGRDHRAGDAEQASDLFRRAVDPGAVVLDEVAALGEFADADFRAAVEAVVGQLLQHQPGELVLRDARLLLQSLDGAEERPVLALEFQILRGFLAG